MQKRYSFKKGIRSLVRFILSIVLITLNLSQFKLRPKTYGGKYVIGGDHPKRKGKIGAKYLIDKQRTYGGSIHSILT